MLLSLRALLAISLGASAGAIARWLLGVGLNGLFPSLPPGTLAAISAHVVGSLELTLAGLATVTALAALPRS